jgi:hypothetical protein
MKSPRRLPFAGIVERPYDQAILTNVDWLGIKPVYVQFKDLHLTQEKLTVLGLFGIQSYSTDPHIRVVDWENKLYVEDGHHRLIERAIQRGESSQGVSLCRVFMASYTLSVEFV